MERINQFEFFELGETLQKIKDYSDIDVIPNDALFPIYSATRQSTLWSAASP